MSDRLIPTEFYDRPTLTVARQLLGMLLVRNFQGKRMAGIITETEAYIGESDLGCHAKAGRTPRTEIMYGPPGRAYVYFTYGMHWMLNAVTEREGFPAAILLRGIHPVEGVEIISSNRNGKGTDGPAKLTQSLSIRREFNGCNLCNRTGDLWIELGEPISDDRVTIGPRVGLYSVPEPWKSKPWRFKAHLLE